MTRGITKATSIQFIDGRSHMKKWRGCKTALSGYYACLSRDLLLMPLWGGHTHIRTPTFVDEMILRDQAYAGLQPACAWFKNVS